MTTETTEHDEAPFARGGTLARAETLFNAWAHIVGEDTDWRAALRREYWLHLVGRFRPGDRVEVHSWDHRFQFSMHIIDVNAAIDPYYLDVAFTPLCPADLQLPPMPRQRDPRYAVRQAPGGAGHFNVLDLSTGMPVHDNPKDRNAAVELAATLERQQTASAEQLVDAFVRQHHAAGESVTDVTHAEPAVTAGAARTRRYRERQRTEAGAA